MSDDKKLSITESSDFYTLLELMVPLYQQEAYAWLPELFSIIGHQSLLKLAKYAGGETIRIPTLEELETAIESLGWYYKVYILHKKRRKSIPFEYLEQVDKIKEVFDAADS
jgi:hypothetical protein